MLVSKFVDDLEESLHQARFLAFSKTVDVGSGVDLGIGYIDNAEFRMRNEFYIGDYTDTDTAGDRQPDCLAATDLHDVGDLYPCLKVRASCKPDGADVVMEVCGLASVVPTGIHMLRVGGRYVIGGLVNPNDNFTVDGNEILRKLIVLKGVHNYHPRHLIQALDFVMANRTRFPFKDLVDSKFSLEQLDLAFARASERAVLRAAVVP